MIAEFRKSFTKEDAINAIASYETVKSALYYAVSVSDAWMKDANPFNDLKPGDSAEYDSAYQFNNTMRQALVELEGNKPTEVK